MTENGKKIKHDGGEDKQVAGIGTSPPQINILASNQTTIIQTGVDDAVSINEPQSYSRPVVDNTENDTGQILNPKEDRDGLENKTSGQNDPYDSTIVVMSSVERDRQSSSHSTRRRVTTTANPSDAENGCVEREDDDDRKKENQTNKKIYERCNNYNIVKHVVSIVFIVSDVVFDWIEYVEMNNRGNISVEIPTEQTPKYTENCEEMGSCIQSAYLIFTIVGTVVATVQIGNIIYQTSYECRNKKAKVSKVKIKLPKWTKLVNETMESFLLLVFVEYGQVLLLMGFYDSEVCIKEYDVVVNKKTIILVLNGFFSFLRISWRLLTSCKCCTFSTKIPERERIVENRIQTKPFGCELPCSCFLLRCCPTSPDEKAVQCFCMCRKCLSSEQNFGCFIFRTFPSFLPSPKEDIFECTCIKCLKCETNLGCCVLRCCPTYLEPRKEEICTGRCRPCLAKEFPCKCFTFRCFPKFLDPQPANTDICTSRCRPCMAKEFPCKCFTFRCFPSFLEPKKEEVWVCHCPECLACTIPCGCFTFRMCPKYLPVPHSDIWTCTCKECLTSENKLLCCTLRCFPEELTPPKTKWCECTCCSPNIVEPQPQTIERVPQPPKRRQQCIPILLTLLAFLVALLLLSYAFIVALHIFVSLVEVDIEKIGFLNYIFVNIIRNFVKNVVRC